MRFHDLSIAGIVVTAVCIQLDSDMCFTQEKGDIWTWSCEDASVAGVRLFRRSRRPFACLKKS